MEELRALATNVDIGWTLVGAALVFFMQAGFAMVETGLTRAKNAGNIVMKNLMDFCIGTPIYWFIGFGIMFGGTGALIGGLDLFSMKSTDYTTMIFQTVFCATSATIVSGADAIHPGFGFLSENSKFVELCEQCHITFIGPNSDVIRKMGHKAEARNTMIQAGVPVIPGSKEPIYDAKTGAKIAEEIGYPVIVKAALGGGGKGMRVAHNADEFETSFQTAQKEAEMAFADGTMYIEHFVQHPRHIEFQILADSYGNVIHLGERDCSIQ